MNRQFISTAFLFLIYLYSFGQDKKFGVKLQIGNAVKDDINLGWFNIDAESVDGYNLKWNTFRYGIIGLYNSTEQTTLRLGFNISKTHVLEYGKYYSGGAYFDESNNGTQTISQISPGITWKLPYKKIDFYGGFEALITFHGEYVMDWIYTRTDTSTGTIFAQGEEITKLPKGNSYGIGGLFGFEYNAAKWISIGAEFSPSISYARLSGQTETIVTTQVPSSSRYTYNTQDEEKGIAFYDTKFSIGVTAWF